MPDDEIYHPPVAMTFTMKRRCYPVRYIPVGHNKLISHDKLFIFAYRLHLPKSSHFVKSVETNFEEHFVGSLPLKQRHVSGGGSQ